MSSNSAKYQMFGISKIVGMQICYDEMSLKTARFIQSVRR
jgi:hypothetical protein